jgi:formylglycine-generating enzyme required for sulfatase activity
MAGNKTGRPAPVPPGLILALLACTLAPLACPSGGDASADAGMLKTPGEYRELVAVIPPGSSAAVPGSGGAGVFVAGRNLALGPFSMAKHETTWELWKEVCDWAVTRGYRIANPGTQGHGSSGTGDAAKGWTGEERRRRPVTDITWRDAVVWCNAYSELCGLEPVYYQEDGLSPLRVSVNNTPESPSRIDTAADRCVMRRDNNGFRLPLEAEWEFAARGAGPGAADWDLPYAGSGTLDDAAWYSANAAGLGKNSADYGVHPPGLKKPNRPGLFDLSGNVAEWCWDWDNEQGVRPETPLEGDGPGRFAHRVTRGGSWQNDAPACETRDRNYCRPFASGAYLGFRLARTTGAENR